VKITPETISTQFDNPNNAKEGFGVFLVKPIKGNIHLDVQMIDELKVFTSDKQARQYLHSKIYVEKSKRHERLLANIAAVDPGLGLKVTHAGKFRPTRSAD